MQRRYLAPLGALAVVLTLISLIAVSVAGQAPIGNLEATGPA